MTPSIFPHIDVCMVLNLTPVDVHVETATRWLQALIWPEHRDRQRALTAALALAKQYHLDIVAGNASALLPEVLAKVPKNVIPCVFHSYTLNQMSQAIAEQPLRP